MHTETAETPEAQLAERQGAAEDPDGGYHFAESGSVPVEEPKPKPKWRLVPLADMRREERRRLGVHAGGDLLRRLFVAVPA